MSDFTPGPWEVRRSSSGYPYAIRAPNGNRGPGGIIDVTRWGAISMPSSPEAEANARLISAAPDLYGSTAPLDHIGRDEELALMPNDQRATIVIGAHSFFVTLGDFKNISAALAKARGEP